MVGLVARAIATKFVIHGNKHNINTQDIKKKGFLLFSKFPAKGGWREEQEDAEGMGQRIIFGQRDGIHFEFSFSFVKCIFFSLRPIHC